MSCFVLIREWDGFWFSADNSVTPSDSSSSLSSSPAPTSAPSSSLVVPPRCGLATFSPQGAVLLLHHCGLPPPSCAPTHTHPQSHPMPIGVLWSDTSVNIAWPFADTDDPVVSPADAALPPLDQALARLSVPDCSCDVLLYGATGYFGSNLLRILLEAGVDVRCPRTRLEDRPGLQRDAAFFRPRRVINCAGVTGTPNIMWCETHQPETARGNLVGVMNLLDVFAPRDVHVTTIGTGVMYCYDAEHRLDNDVGFVESDPPTYLGNVYVRLRVAQEQLVEETFPGKCLTLRVQYPLSADMHRGSCLSKLLNYAKIFGSATSMTVLDDLFPLINQLSLDRVTGPLNFTNPGRMDNVALLARYREVVDAQVAFEVGSAEEIEQFVSIPRPFSLLDTSRLQQLCPGVPSLEQSVESMLSKMAERKRTEQKQGL